MTSGDRCDGAAAGGCTILGKSEIAQLPAAIEAGTFVWIDLQNVRDTEIASIGELLGLHPLTTEDLQHFDQRAKIEDYENYIYLVSYGAAGPDDDDRLAEVHIVYSERFLVTVSRGDSIELRAMHGEARTTHLRGIELLHQVLDRLVDSFGPLLDEIDDELERLEDRIFQRDLKGFELEIHRVRRRLARINRVSHRQSEAYTGLREALSRLPDQDPAHHPYFRDVQDHLIHVTEATDSLRDRISGVSEIYLAAIDMRQNLIMKEFTVIAGIFLPLSVLVGYFGQNFRWMTDHIAGWLSFTIFGVVLPTLIVAALLYVFRRRGLLKD
ncbi:MAG: magnesium transporter CorA family protein [Solirubrobacterales bacterium]